MTINETPDLLKGRIDAFEFLARQCETYADDNDALHKRYKTNKAVAAKRSETFRSVAAECRAYAKPQQEALDKMLAAPQINPRPPLNVTQKGQLMYSALLTEAAVLEAEGKMIAGYTIHQAAIRNLGVSLARLYDRIVR